MKMYWINRRESPKPPLRKGAVYSSLGTYKIFLAGIGLLILLSCTRSDGPRKIRLADQNITTESDAQLSTTIYLEEQERRSLAVLFFQNKTGDQNLEWLKKGLTEMFIRTLGQSPSLSVMGTDRIHEIAERLGKDASSENMDMDMAAVFAREANVEAILTGSITKNGDSRQINVSLHEPRQGMVLRQESIEGPGMENLFAMVDQITQKLKEDLKLSSDIAEPGKGLAETSTQSLEAWQHYTAGMDLMNQVLTPEARVEFEKAVALDSTFVTARFMLAISHFGVGETQKALKTFESAKKLRDKATLKERYQIDLFEALLNGDEVTMLDVYDRMIKTYPDSRETSYNLGNYYFGNRRYEDAVGYYDRVLTIDPKHKMTLNQIGYASALTGDFENAESTLKKYMELAPDEPNPYDSMGEILWMQGRFKEAESWFEKALNKNRTFPGSWDHLAQLHLDAGNYKKAMKTLKEYHEIAQSDAQKAAAEYLLGVTAWRLGQIDEAAQYFNAALDRIMTFNNAIERLVEMNQETHREQETPPRLIALYDRVSQKVDYEDRSLQHLNTLVILSLNYGINPEQTMEHIDQFLKTSDQPFALIQLLFLKQLFTFRLDLSPGEEQILQGRDAVQLSRFLDFNRSLGYANLFQFFHRFNKVFYRSPEDAAPFYETLIQACSEKGSRSYEMAFRALMADVERKVGKVDEAESLRRLVGMPDESLWRVIGPFDNRDGFLKIFPPEKKLDFDSPVREGRQIFSWKAHADSVQDGFIDLKSDFEQNRWAVAYAVVDVVVKENRDGFLRLGNTDPVIVWLNGKEIWRFNRIQEAIPDDQSIPVSLKAGRNRFLIKLANRLDEWGFYFRLSDSKGIGLADMEFLSPVQTKELALSQFNAE